MTVTVYEYRTSSIDVTHNVTITVSLWQRTDALALCCPSLVLRSDKGV